MGEIALPEGIARIKKELMSRLVKIEAALPDGVDAEIYIEDVCDTLLMSKDGATILEKGSLGSVILAVMQAAKAGLWLNGSDAALVPRQGRVVFSPMVWGLVKLCRQHPDVDNIASGLAREMDECEVVQGGSPDVIHKIYTSGPRGPITGAYAVAWLATGHKQVEWVGIDEMEKFQQKYTAVWKEWPEEMLPIRPLRRLMKKLPRSTRATEALQSADRADPRVDDEPDADPDTEASTEGANGGGGEQQEAPQEEPKETRAEAAARLVRGRQTRQVGSSEEPEGFMNEGGGDESLPM